jgi:hypothetical protein
MRGASASTVISAFISSRPAACMRAATARRKTRLSTPAITRIAVGKVLADVAEAQSPQHGVAQRVNDHIAVRVRHDALRVRNGHAAQNDVIAVAEGMHVETLTDSHGSPPSFSAPPSRPHNPARMASAKPKSLGVVTLILNADPAPAAPGNPRRSMACASSVTVTPERCASLKACPTDLSEIPAASAPATNPRDQRFLIAPPRSRLTVSTMGDESTAPFTAHRGALHRPAPVTLRRGAHALDDVDQRSQVLRTSEQGAPHRAPTPNHPRRPAWPKNLQTVQSPTRLGCCRQRRCVF